MSCRERQQAFLIVFGSDLFLELLPGEKDPALDRSDLDVELFRDLLIVKTPVEHQEGPAVILFQIVDHAMQLLGHDIRAGPVVRSARSDRLQMLLDGLLDVVAHPAFAVIVDKGVAHDRRHPRFEIGALREFLAIAKSAIGRFLKKIAGVFPVMSEFHGKADQEVFQCVELSFELCCGHMKGTVLVKGCIKRGSILMPLF